MKFWLSCCSEPLPGRRSQIKALLVRIRFREGRPPGQNGSVGADLGAARREWQGKAEQSSDRDSGRLGDAALPTPGKTDSPHEGKAAGERDLSLLGAVSSTRNVSRLCLNPFIDHWQFLRFEFCTKLD